MCICLHRWAVCVLSFAHIFTRMSACLSICCCSVLYWLLVSTPAHRDALACSQRCFTLFLAFCMMLLLLLVAVHLPLLLLVRVHLPLLLLLRVQRVLLLVLQVHVVLLFLLLYVCRIRVLTPSLMRNLSRRLAVYWQLLSWIDPGRLLLHLSSSTSIRSSQDAFLR